MKQMFVGLSMWLAFGGAWAQQVWRCEVDGQVRYTDQPCEKGGTPVPTRVLQPNGVDGAAEAASSAAADAPLQVASQPAAEPAPHRSPRKRGAQGAQFAMQGLMNTDFVQRGYVPRRQNPATSPTP